MSIIYSYLTFNGNCREAMDFYKRCLGGELSFQTIGDTPLSNSLPVEFRKLILQAVLTSDKLVLMASDMVQEDYLIPGNAVSMMLLCKNEREARNYYRKLSQGGEQTSPLAYNEAGSLTGTLTDKYRNPWIIHFSTNYTHN